MEAQITANIHMWAVFAIVLIALAFYVAEIWRMEITSLGVIAALMAYFHVFGGSATVSGAPLSQDMILAGFANTALIAVLSLLIMGQAVIRTGILDQLAQLFLDRMRSKVPASVAILIVLGFVMGVSAFLNNTPVVVIFIPIMQALADRYGLSPSRVMMPLSFAAILGGMTTLIGSSTNLLVNTALVDIDFPPLGFFDFTIPGLMLASVGMIYAVFVVPRILPDRARLVESELPGKDGKQFLFQVNVKAGTSLVGAQSVGGLFKELPNMTVRLIQRGERAILPPFDGISVEPDDVIIVASTRSVLMEAMAEHGDVFHPDLEDGKEDPGEGDGAPWQQGDQLLAEVMVAPASRFIGQNLRLAGFRYKTHCIVVGIQRRARMIRARMTEIRLEAGDVLLIQGPPEDVAALRGNRDVILIESSRQELPKLDHAKSAGIIFFGAVALAAMGLVPIVLSAFVGALLMIVSGVLNLRQAFRAIDPKIATAIAAALAMSAALKETGGAAYIAQSIVLLTDGIGALGVLSLLFLAAALLTNILSNNAVAVLFTPIAVDLAINLGLSPTLFAIAMLFAANCSFASPMGYQTNLLVMGPGHHKFQDFVRAGLPLIIIMWLTFTAVAAFYWDL